eukprot:m.345577 g.345577  ORF g.345577 m.345577 type:complete len:625 (+) comp26766_c0_seq1:92-1966(+)
MSIAVGNRSKTKHKVRVIVRVRPRLPSAVESQEVPFQISDNEVILPNPRLEGDTVSYKFDRCYPTEANQRKLFEKEISPFINTTLDGANATVFAYGPTGAGKTFTMQGTEKNEGVIPRAVDVLLQAQQDRPGKTEIRMSFLEIYNEKVLDLLEPKNADLQIRESQTGEIFIPNLASVHLTSKSEFRQIFSHALQQRSIASTKLNMQSSRSHAVLIIEVKQMEHNKVIKSGKLHLIDLAGSEDNRRTDNKGMRMKESGAINSSLFVLGKVVDALNKKQPRIPYRDSKLTRLLQDSLGGTSRACIIINIAPYRAKSLQETSSALSFGAKSRNITNKNAPSRCIALTSSRGPTPTCQEQNNPVRKRARDNHSGLSTPTKKRKHNAAKTQKSNELILEERLFKKLENKLLNRLTQVDRKNADKENKNMPLGNITNQNIMTPASKLKVAKAILLQAKAYEKHDPGAALQCYEEACDLLPAKRSKLQVIMTGLRQQKKRKADKHTEETIMITDESDSDIEWLPTPPQVKKTVRRKSLTKKVKPTEPADANLSDEMRASLMQDLLLYLNDSGLKQLMMLKGVGKKRAENILRFREGERPLDKMDDLRLCGFSDAMISTFSQNNTMFMLELR